MRACSSASGGVFFIPDEIERKATPVSYRDLVKEESEKKEQKSRVLFGKKTAKSIAEERLSKTEVA